jgi:thioredoxin 1
MGPVIDELANETQGRANVAKVNVDESPEIATRFDVRSIPTFIVVRDGNAADRLVGIQTRQALATALAA